MANTNTDLTEEDAADLQFPKDIAFSSSLSIQNQFLNNQTNINTICANCSVELLAPYIYCPQCRTDICKNCFSNGAEFDDHQNNHNYQIIRDDFTLYPSINNNWTAREERTLLDSLLRHGNWTLVANDLPKRSYAEIVQHYDYYYLRRHGSRDLPVIRETESSVFAPIVVPYRQRLATDSDEPPRYTAASIGYRHLAGYNAARSDFEMEFDANAEDLVGNLKAIDDDDAYCGVLVRLQCGLVRSYNRRLCERQRWKRVIRDYGLILLRKTYSWLHRYDATITKPVCGQLIRFMQFLGPQQFQMLMEGLHRSGELRIQIMRLCALRHKGIRTLADARLYMSLNQIHEQCESDLKSFHMNSNFNYWKLNYRSGISSSGSNVTRTTFDFPVSKRRSGFTPIEIIGMAGYDKLSISERDLCRSIRLVPMLYLELKDILITENKKMGHIKLKTARKLLKIDVNKTRRLYDFLVQEGHIMKIN